MNHRLHSTPALTPAVIEEFWKLCHWTYEVWVTHRVFFDDNPDEALLVKSKHDPFLRMLNTVLLEYTLLQMAKLHDPAVQRGKVNLSLEYVRKFGQWDDETAKTLKQLHAKLNELFEKIKPARDKILAHNDRQTFLDNRPLGGFPENADVKYFAVLKDFISIVQGSPFEYGSFPKTDARIVVNALVESLHSNRKRPSS